jgi:hypothetical protein
MLSSVDLTIECSEHRDTNIFVGAAASEGCTFPLLTGSLLVPNKFKRVGLVAPKLQDLDNEVRASGSFRLRLYVVEIL